MTNYTFAKGRRDRKIRFIQRFIFALALAWSVLAGLQTLFHYWEVRDAQIMSIHYCWDSNGDHYVVPDERCTH